MALNRSQAGATIDQLSYSYTVNGNATNQLQTVQDANASNSGLVSGTTSYTYDGNGNMLSAANNVNSQQNKSFSYNLLNLPIVATIPTGTATYTYDATGNKIRKVTVLNGVTKTTDYINGIEYDNSTSTIGFIQTEEGKAVPITAGYNYTYYLGDNLGNTRITFDTKTGLAVTQQKDDYYPFGLEILRDTVSSPKNEYLYNRKELQEEFTEYDYGARYYDPVIARWNTVDLLAEISRRWSPYNYVLNNPVRLIDPDGMSVDQINGGWRFSNEDGSTDASDAFSLWKNSSHNNKGSLGVITFGKEEVWGKAIQDIFPQTIYRNIPAGAGQGGYEDFYDALKSISDQSANGIGFLGIFSHGDVDYAKWRGTYGEGMIFANAKRNPDADNVYTSDLEKLENSVNSNDIRFAENSVIYMGGCNAGTQYKDGKSFAMELAKATGSYVYATANGHMDALDPNNRHNTTFLPDNNGTLNIYHWIKADYFGTQTIAPNQTVNVAELIKNYFTLP